MSGSGHRLNKNQTIPAEYNHNTHKSPKMWDGSQKGANPSEFGICNQLILRGEPIFSPASLRGRVNNERRELRMDLIDRQALLKQIEIDSDGEPGYYGDTWKFIDTIKNLPSAADNNVGTKLGTNLAEVGTDCISRQAAIDALYSVDEYNSRSVKAIKQLPPIQPGIVRCKDCKYARLTNDGSCKYCDIWFPDEAEYMDGDYYCASAERKSNG